MVYRHSGFPGGLTATPIGEVLDKDARKAIEKAVWGMLPKNKLGRQMLKKLKVYAGPDAPARGPAGRALRDQEDLPVTDSTDAKDQGINVADTANTDGTESTEVEETFESDEQGLAYTSETSPSAARLAPARRPSPPARPPAVARRPSPASASSRAPASGRINGRTLESYFPNKLHQQVVNEPFTALGLEGRFDVIARIHGGGITGQAGALRLGVARVASTRSTSTPTARRSRRPAC